ncbi:MAG TPA: hypothetical protein VNQ76_10740 [Planctomicrobium sp.]|nr:hypothetical protein [Planctomicrobium sp.]
MRRLVTGVRTDSVSGDPSLFDGIFPGDLLTRRKGTGRSDPYVLMPRHMPEFLMSNRDGIR